MKEFFKFLYTCEWRRVQRVMPEFIYLGVNRVMSFIGEEVKWKQLEG